MSEQAKVIETLSKRELEVAAAYADGSSYKEIARDLGISPTTVRSHLRTVYSKLNVTSKIALAQMLADPDQGIAAPMDDDGLTADLALELDEAIRRERMMARVLRIISQKDADLDDVLDEVLDHALEICEAEFGILMAHHGDMTFAEMRSRNISKAFGEWLSQQGAFKPGAETAVGRAAKSLKPVSVADVGGEGISWDENPLRMATVEYGRARSLAAIPMMAGGRLIGVFSVYRTRVHPFNDRALELAQAFADQAAIAIENASQFAAIEARLAQAAASREILEAISNASGDEGPVFDAILRNARSLCDAPFAALILGRETDGYQTMIAHHGAVQSTEDIYSQGRVPMDPKKSFAARAIISGRPVHLPNMKDTDLYRAGVPNVVELCDLQGIRTNLFVPLIKDGTGIGCFIIFRHEVQPFSEDQIALVETFAAQAVIALENVRQFQELQKQLDRDAAAREILQAISHSRDDEAPVFDAILKNAAKICGAPMARLELADRAQNTFHCAAAWGEEMRSFKIGEVMSLDHPNDLPTAIREGVVRHIHDLSTTEIYLSGEPTRVRMVEEEGYHTYLIVPLLADGVGVGGIVLSRREVAPFAEADISLLESFARQAVIAIENVRRFRALQDRLDREAATKDILQAINQNRDDALPVFDAILRKAVDLCGAHAGAFVLGAKGDAHQRLVTSFGASQSARDDYERGRVSMDPDISVAARAILTGKVVHVENMAETEGYRNRIPHYVSVVEDTGIRTNLLVPLMTSAGGAGVLVLFRKEVKPYTQDEIDLVETFAAQAAIALENVRQFNDLQKRLEREAATSQILGAISASREDDIPVFHTILENACKVCDAQSGFITVVDESGENLTGPAQYGVGAEFARTFEGWSAPLATSPLGAARCIRERRAIAIDDIADTDLYREGNMERVRQVDIEGMRSIVCVPLLSQDAGLGSMILYRKQVQPFSAEETTVVEAFAAQAVIAIENARQFRALQSRTSEVQMLNASLEAKVKDQVGEIERMGRLKRFLPPAVADTVVSSGSEAMLKSHRALLGVLFCDIRGFTAFCETAEPEETIEVLQTYHEEMGKLINDHGAGVDLRMGDGFMVLFNDPVSCDDPAGDAVRLAIAMRARMAELCKKWRRLGHRLGFGVGVSLGYATVGMVGFEGRFDYTASGTAINLASRLCDEAEDGEILLSTRAGIAVEEAFAIETRGELVLKGIREPVEVFKLAGKAQVDHQDLG